MEIPLRYPSDVASPKVVYALLDGDGRMVRVSLPRRSDWEVGDVVKIDEGLIRANLVE